jgi:hypothetical protein
MIRQPAASNVRIQPDSQPNNNFSSEISLSVYNDFS